MNERDLPIALKCLIENNNLLLNNYKTKLYEQVRLSNQEMMIILNLDPSDGWRLDLDAMKYVRLSPDESDVYNSEYSEKLGISQD